MEPTPPNADDQQATDGAQQEAPAKAFTIKSITFGFLILFFTIFITNYNDYVLGQPEFVQNYIPPGPLFLMLCLVLAWNPICKRIWQAGCLHRKELTVALFIALAGCWTAGSGLNRWFSYGVIKSWDIYGNSTYMQNNGTMDYLPKHLFPLGGKENAKLAPDIEVTQEDGSVVKYNADQLVYKNFSTGVPEGAPIPYDAWTSPVTIYPDSNSLANAEPEVISSIGPIFHWISLFGVFAICILAMALIVHRQWSHYEQLSYPIAQITGSFIDRQNARTLPDIFYKRSFWIAAGFVFAFHLVRLIHVWFPTYCPDILIEAWFGWIPDVFPTVNKSGSFRILHFKWVFAVIGITFFLPREIGLSLGLSNLLLTFVSYQVYMQTGSSFSKDIGGTRVGAYFAYAAVILFTGRYYYWTTLKKALTFKSGNENESDGIFAMRLFFVSYIALMVVLTISFNVTWYIALVYSLLVLLMFLVVARIACETGIPYMTSAFAPHGVVTSLFGVSAVGAAPLVMIYYIGITLTQEPKECLMPYLSNGLKISEKHKINLRPLVKLGAAVLIISLVASIFIRISEHYTLGSNKTNDIRGQVWAINNQIKSATHKVAEMKRIGHVDESTGLAKAEGSLANFELGDMSSIIIGAVCVLVFFSLRFRFTGFPLHPVLFLVWGTVAMNNTFYSFLIGWGIRELIVRFGGGTVYQSCKPFFIGLIFGEIMAAMCGISVGFSYHFATIPEDGGLFDGNIPKEFEVVK